VYERIPSATETLDDQGKDRQTKIHEVGNGLHFVSFDDYDNEYYINLNKTVRQLTGYRVEKIWELEKVGQNRRLLCCGLTLLTEYGHKYSATYALSVCHKTLFKILQYFAYKRVSSCYVTLNKFCVKHAKRQHTADFTFAPNEANQA